ncbi:unnamed protein product [Macrosiphum euphorbiae]|uniref:Uncharacterized protein n=1 Tax=Macrosiphum euphorbiae TaxID=13131 RepID=A0AAV0X1A7_9HEMI|nr:unnamed protein product [Macrosiphum euphorbiae]
MPIGYFPTFSNKLLLPTITVHYRSADHSCCSSTTLLLRGSVYVAVCRVLQPYLQLGRTIHLINITHKTTRRRVFTIFCFNYASIDDDDDKLFCHCRKRFTRALIVKIILPSPISVVLLLRRRVFTLSRSCARDCRRQCLDNCFLIHFISVFTSYFKFHHTLLSAHPAVRMP